MGPERRDTRNENTTSGNLPVIRLRDEALGSDEMRITFFGSWYNPRPAQACNSVFVELGNGDCFVFDCGTGVTAKYNAVGIDLERMNKIFLTHLHGDHMSDLLHIYTFGPAYDRKNPLYVWGPSDSGVIDPVTKNTHQDGTKAYCKLLREACRWHTESFSFQSTQLTNPVTPTWQKPAPSEYAGYVDAYDLVPFECQWNTGPKGEAVYIANGVTITSFPAVHTRQGAISYKLVWAGKKDGIPFTRSMIFTGDTKPTQYVVTQAAAAEQPLDVLIHEIAPSAETWTQHFTGLSPDNPEEADAYWRDVQAAQAVIDSSHTPPEAFGYILRQLQLQPLKKAPTKNYAPRVAIGTHYPTEEDTLQEATSGIKSWYKPEDGHHVLIADDFLVVSVTSEKVTWGVAAHDDHAWAAIDESISMADPSEFATPKYSANGMGDPYAQLDPNSKDYWITSDQYDPGNVNASRRAAKVLV